MQIYNESSVVSFVEVLPKGQAMGCNPDLTVASFLQFLQCLQYGSHGPSVKSVFVSAVRQLLFGQVQPESWWIHQDKQICFASVW